MITVTAMKWAPPFAAGQVRDHRVRWILNEVGWPYEVRLVDAPTMKSAAYGRGLQPFGQLPVLEEEGRPPVFESGAIVLDVAMRAGRCIAAEGTPERAAALQWVIAGLNSVEPVLFNVSEVEYFMDDEEARNARRPLVVRLAKERLAMLESARRARLVRGRRFHGRRPDARFHPQGCRPACAVGRAAGAGGVAADHTRASRACAGRAGPAGRYRPSHA